MIQKFNKLEKPIEIKKKSQNKKNQREKIQKTKNRTKIKILNGWPIW